MSAGPSVGKYDADEASLFWYKYSGGDDDALEKLLARRSKLTQEEKLQELDYEIDEKDRRVKNLAVNINKVIAREQRKLSAPEELDNLKGGRQRRIQGAAVKIQVRCREERSDEGLLIPRWLALRVFNTARSS